MRTRRFPYLPWIFAVTIALAAVLVAIALMRMPAPESETGALAKCPGSMSESQAKQRGLAEASRLKLSAASIVKSRLLTRSQLESSTRLTLGEPGATCVWYLEMSGYRVETDFPPGTSRPTPPAMSTVLEMALDSESGWPVTYIIAAQPDATTTP